MCICTHTMFWIWNFYAYYLFSYTLPAYAPCSILSYILFFWLRALADVPEGSFIIREHSPMSNLFSCLWFNEVDRFTSRDQLSFAYTYLKLVRTNPGKRFYLNMFKVSCFFPIIVNFQNGMIHQTPCILLLSIY